MSITTAAQKSPMSSGNRLAVANEGQADGASLLKSDIRRQEFFPQRGREGNKSTSLHDSGGVRATFRIMHIDVK